MDEDIFMISLIATVVIIGMLLIGGLIWLSIESETELDNCAKQCYLGNGRDVDCVEKCIDYIYNGTEDVEEVKERYGSR